MKRTEGELPEKEKQLFSAVYDLLEEGADLSRLTVSDITQRAGIGKGTAYEYAKSKEELLAKAMGHQVLRSVRALGETVRAKEGLEAKLNGIFDWLDHISRKGRTCRHYISRLFGKDGMSVRLDEEKAGQAESALREITEAMQQDLYAAYRAEEAGEKGHLKEVFFRETLLAQFLGYLVGLQQEDWMKETSEQELRRFTMRGIRLGLGLSDKKKE